MGTAENEPTNRGREATDAELVDRWRAGEREACEALFQRYYAPVVRFFRNKAPAHAGDLAQRTFLTCFQRIARLQDPGRFKPWVLGTAYNVLREHLRATRRERIDFTSISVADLLAGSPVSLVAEHREHARLLGALRSLPLDLQAALELHYWERLTAQQIAETLEIPLGTAKTRLRRARELVHVHMIATRQRGAPSEPRDLDAWAFEVGRAIEPE